MPLAPAAALAELGRRVRALRDAEQVRQIDVADYLGVDRAYVSHIERGMRSPGLGTLMGLSRFLNAPLADLVRGLERIGDDGS